jgi:ATP synthase protein I
VKGPASPWKALSLVGLIGTDLAVCTLIGVWIGQKVDMYFDTAPWWMIVFLFLGIGTGLVTIVPMIKRFLGDQADD